MQVQFTPEQEAQLSAMAQQTGVGSEQLVKEAALTLLQEDAKFRAYVEEESGLRTEESSSNIMRYG